MGFYIFRALFSAFPIDVLLTIYYIKRGLKTIGAFIPVPLYFINTFIWAIILSASDSRFRGQGVLGLILIVSIGIAFSIFRLLLELILLGILYQFGEIVR